MSEGNESPNRYTLESIRARLLKLSEKWKIDFFASREANFENLRQILSNETMVTTEYDNFGKLVGKIYCIVCAKPVRIGYIIHKTRNGNSYNFTNTNYFHHLRTHCTSRSRMNETGRKEKEDGSCQ